MTDKNTQMLLASRVIPVLRLASREQAATAIDCLIEAGFNTVEVTLTTPARSNWSGSCDAAAMQSSWSGQGPSSTCAVRRPAWTRAPTIWSRLAWCLEWLRWRKRRGASP
jgi:hypothetical protein